MFCILEVLQNGRSRHKKEKIRERVELIRDRICAGCASYGVRRQVHAFLVVLNGSAAADGRGVNLFVDDNFIVEDGKNLQEAVKNNSVAFIDFMERNMVDVRGIIEKSKNEEKDAQTAILRAAWDILNWFGESNRINVSRLANLKADIFKNLRHGWEHGNFCAGHP